ETAMGAGLAVIGIKLFADGVITGRTAALSRPFAEGTDTGMLIHEPDALAGMVRRSIGMGLPVGIHAMGDRGIDVAIDAIEEVMGRHSSDGRPSRGPLAHPHRIEHCSIPSARSLERMRSLGIVPVPQPVFLFAEGEAYLAQLGRERTAGAYPLRTMIELGLRPALSSDAPATSTEDAANPWLGIAAAVTRRSWAGTELGSSERLSIEEAIALYTAGGADVLRLADRVGSVDVGREADLVVYGDDPLAMSPNDLSAIVPELVMAKGRIGHGNAAGGTASFSGRRGSPVRGLGPLPRW
ncbi:MAG TPA: amidohydrolase family protein, partial [Actinomycetota bacterium]|nr:amidohydrolase family protein [Actinomycetota bacterium]